MNKRKLTSAEKRHRKNRKANFRIIFVNGKQKRVPREPLIDGMPVDEFIARNADVQWLHATGQWELMPQDLADVRPQFADSNAVDQPDPDQDVINESSNHRRETHEGNGTEFDYIPF